MAQTRSKVRQQQQQKQVVREADPLTLLALAREELYTDVPKANRGSLHAIEEVITRMETQTRAIAGTAVGSFAGGGESADQI